MKRKIEIEELKQLEIKLLKVFNDYCLGHNLRYTITYGTLIGAVRHKGFIPWDDDIDVMMPRKDYEQLIRSFNNDCTDVNVKLISYVSNFDYYLPIAKLIDTRTVLKEKTDIDQEIGVYIDIFPLDNLADDYEIAKKRIREGFRYNEKLMIKTISISSDRKFYKNAVLVIGKKLLRNKDLKSILFELDKYCLEVNPDVLTKFVGVMCGISAGDSSRVFKKEWFETTIPVEFEGNFYPAPVGFDPFLRQLYADYMMLPPEDKQVSHHKFDAWYK